MSDHITSLRWLGNQLDADAADQGIGQGSEGARICWNAAIEIESLRQQLDAANNLITTYRNDATNLRQQLADSQKREVMLRDVMQEVLDAVWLKTSHELARKFSNALTATADLDGLILCHAEPHEFQWKLRSNGFVQHTSKMLELESADLWDVTPLYLARKPKS